MSFEVRKIEGCLGTLELFGNKIGGRVSTIVRGVTAALSFTLHVFSSFASLFLPVCIIMIAPKFVIRKAPRQ